MEPTDFRQSQIDNLFSYGDIRGFLLKNGYFPEAWVLPPFLDITLRSGISDTEKRDPVVLYTPKDDTAWRDFRIVHPSNFEAVANILDDRATKTALEIIYKSSQKIISYSVPVVFSSSGSRAAKQINQWTTLQDDILLQSGRYGYEHLVVADIANCYHTLYTHTIEWAFKNIGMTGLGNDIDTALRRGNSNRTHGIVVGPYVSDFVAEVVLCELDARVESALSLLDYIGFRYKDNYYFLCRNDAGAHKILQKLSIELRESHLVLNNQKTDSTKVTNYFASFWQTDFAAIITSFNMNIWPTGLYETKNINTLNAIVRAVMRLSAKHNHQKAIIDKSLNYLSCYRPYPSDYRLYFYTLASMLQVRSSAFPKVFNLLQAMVKEQPSLINELTELTLHLIKQARENEDNFTLCWLSYLFSDTNISEIYHELRTALTHKDGLGGVANDYISFVQTGATPTDDPLWRHAPDSTNLSSIVFSQKNKMTIEELYEHLKVRFAES